MSIERAQALIDLKRYDDAIAILEERLATHPYDSDALLNLGFAQLFNRSLDDALRTTELGISVDHNLSSLHGLRGDILWRMKRFDDAYESFETTLELSPDSVATRAQYIDALLADPRSKPATDRRQLVRATELAEQLVELAPDDWLSHYEDARVKGLRGRAGDAETAVRRALKISPNSAEAHNLLAAIQKAKGNLRGAGDSYVAAGRANPQAANVGGLESLGKVIAPVGIGAMVIMRVARGAGKGTDMAGGSIALVLLVVAVVVAIGFIAKSAQPQPQSRTDYSHLSKDAQDVINRNRH